jgi:prophage regulatory protein
MSNSLDERSTGFLRLSSVLAPRGPIPVSKSTWWAGVKTGRRSRQ